MKPTGKPGVTLWFAGLLAETHNSGLSEAITAKRFEEAYAGPDGNTGIDGDVGCCAKFQVDVVGNILRTLLSASVAIHFSHNIGWTPLDFIVNSTDVLTDHSERDQLNSSKKEHNDH